MDGRKRRARARPRSAGTPRAAGRCPPQQDALGASVLGPKLLQPGRPHRWPGARGAAPLGQGRRVSGTGRSRQPPALRLGEKLRRASALLALGSRKQPLLPVRPGKPWRLSGWELVLLVPVPKAVPGTPGMKSRRSFSWSVAPRRADVREEPRASLSSHRGHAWASHGLTRRPHASVSSLRTKHRLSWPQYKAAVEPNPAKGAPEGRGRPSDPPHACPHAGPPFPSAPHLSGPGRPPHPRKPPCDRWGHSPGPVPQA